MSSRLGKFDWLGAKPRPLTREEASYLNANLLDDHVIPRAWLGAVSRADIGARDDWTCGLCREPVDRSHEFADPRAPFVDHIQPLVSGGPNVTENTRIAHLFCSLDRPAWFPDLHAARMGARAAVRELSTLLPLLRQVDLWVPTEGSGSGRRDDPVRKFVERAIAKIPKARSGLGVDRKALRTLADADVKRYALERLRFNVFYLLARMPEIEHWRGERDPRIAVLRLAYRLEHGMIQPYFYEHA
jgi:hypothetical protein